MYCTLADGIVKSISNEEIIHVRLSVNLSTSTSEYISMQVRRDSDPFIDVSIYLSIHPSIHPSIFSIQQSI